MTQHYSHIFFVGIGGIGMSALARYFKSKGAIVNGYDRNPSPLTNALESEGISICFTDSVDQISDDCKNPSQCLVIYTPAIPQDSLILNWFKDHHFILKKRSEVLGLLTRTQQSICVSGTHGKTTISTLISHLLYQSHIGCNAFLGGISQNYNSNLLLDHKSHKVVIEADEYDRSFLQLYSHTAIISATDADHLDIYGTHEKLIEAFQDFTNQIKEDGILIYKTGLNFTPHVKSSVQIYQYNISEGDFHTKDLTLIDGLYHFDFVTPERTIEGLVLGIPGKVNVENAVVALSAAYLHGVSDQELREGLKSFKGINRRFHYHVNTPELAYIDDYAHHPEELKATISSVREIYPDKKITGIFQPHLFSRTQDFAAEFAKALSLLDELWIMDIYPAREKPIKGVSADLILKEVTCTSQLVNCKKIEDLVQTAPLDVLLTLGAGDIDRLVPTIATLLNHRIKS